MMKSTRQRITSRHFASWLAQQKLSLAFTTVQRNPFVFIISALWTGLPFITCLGQPVAARMGASICAATGLGFLIYDDLIAYEEKAVQLATNADEFAKIRQKLPAHRDTLPLFQPQQWVADLEAVCWQLWGEYQGK